MKSERRRSRRRELIRQGLSIVTAVVVVMSARSSLADHYVVPSGSMLPTVEEGDRIVVDKLAYGLRLPFSRLYLSEGDRPRLGEVVVLLSPESGIVLLKRIVAGPGDRIEVVDGRLLINGEEVPVRTVSGEHLEELGQRTHPIRLTRGGGPDYGPITVPADRYLVLGDNRGDSRDGRVFGLVEGSAILGRAVACYWGRGGVQWRRL